MNKIKYIISAFIVVAVAALIIVGCKKEKESCVPDNGTPTIEQDGMSAYLQDFKEKMQSGAKADETLGLEDAMWHLEAVLNYSYDNAGFQFSDIQCDTFTYTIQTMGDEMSMSQINNVFNKLSKDIEASFDKCSLPDKNIMSVQTIFEANGKATSVSVKNVIAISGGIISPDKFGPTDYWNENNGGGKCGSYEGECMNSGAPRELTKKLNMRIPKYACATDVNSKGGYFTDIDEVEIYPSDGTNFMFDENSPCGYKLYVSGPWSPDGCICPDDMNYYLSKGPEIIEHYKPEGKVAVSAQYKFDIAVSVTGFTLHVLHVEYGVFHCYGE